MAAEFPLTHPRGGPEPAPVPARRWLVPFLAHELLVGLALWLPVPYAPAAYLRRSMTFAAQSHFLWQWDALWYREIARHGYVLAGMPRLAATVFFPWVPLVLRAVGADGALVVQQVLAGAIFWLLARRFQRWALSPRDQDRALWLFAANPAFIYYSVIYAEGWTLAAMLASLELADRARFVGAGAASLVAGLTQAPGVLWGLVPLTALVQKLVGGTRRGWSGLLLWGGGTAVGLGLYMAYLQMRFGAPLAFATAQSRVWDGAWRWPWVGWFGPLRLLGRDGSIGQAVLGLAIFAMVSVLAVGLIREAWTLARSADRSWGRPLAVWAVAGLLLSLSFGYRIQLQHSTVRFLSLYFPAYAGLARGVSRPLYAAVLGAMVAVGLFGGALFVHGWFYQ